MERLYCMFISIFSSASSMLSSYYGPGFLENRLFRLFVIHMVLTRYRDIFKTCSGFLHGLIAPSSGPYCNEQLKTSLTNLKDSFIYPVPQCAPHIIAHKWFNDPEPLICTYFLSLLMAELSELLSSCLYLAVPQLKISIPQSIIYIFSNQQFKTLKGMSKLMSIGFLDHMVTLSKVVMILFFSISVWTPRDRSLHTRYVPILRYT